MGIQSYCEDLVANVQTDYMSELACVEDVHATAMEKYQSAIAEKFDTGDSFTISDVWQIAIAVLELPANAIQLAAASQVWLHDFFEMATDDFANPSIFLVLPTAFLTVSILLATFVRS